GTPMDPLPAVSADALLESLRGRFEDLCRSVADAVNQAPTGHVINASEEKVRDLFADFRREAYQTALQLKIDAAEAAFPPPKAPHRGRPPNKGPGAHTGPTVNDPPQPQPTPRYTPAPCGPTPPGHRPDAPQAPRTPGP